MVRTQAGPECRDGDSPAELVARCLRHEDGAWQELLGRYSRLIYSTIQKVGLPPDERDEAYQAAVVAIYERLDSLRDPSSLVPWIIGIAWRQSIDCIRKRTRESRCFERWTSQDAGEMPSAPPDEALLLLERAQQAQEALAAMPERCRRLLHILFYEHPAPEYAEIARREKMPIGSLGPTRARCIERLRSYFKQRGWLT